MVENFLQMKKKIITETLVELGIKPYHETADTNEMQKLLKNSFQILNILNKRKIPK